MDRILQMERVILLLFTELRRYIPLVTFIFVMVISFFSVTYTHTGVAAGNSSVHIEGAGTKENPFVIYTFAGLEKIGSEGYPLDAHYLLANDLDASPTKDKNYNNGEGWDPISEVADGENGVLKPFSGFFDGQGYQIKNLYTNSRKMGGGLFLINQKGVIKNLGLVDAQIKGTYQMAGLVCANNGIVENCFVQGRIEGREIIAGLAGLNWEDGEIKDSFFKGSIVASDHGESEYPYIGGLCCINKGSIERCYTQGDLKGDRYVGGLVALNEGEIRESFVEGRIQANRIIGGLVADNEGIVENAYVLGEIRGEAELAGLVSNNTGLIRNTYYAGNLEYRSQTDEAGGLVSSIAYDGEVVNSYWSTKSTVHSMGGLGVSKLQLKQTTTFENWDFTRIWAIAEGASYPYLQFEDRAGNLPGQGEQSMVKDSSSLQDPSPAASSGISGKGTPEAPFVITTFAGLEMIGRPGYPLDAHYVLGSDLDATVTEDSDYNQGKGWAPIGEVYDLNNGNWVGFDGTFDGQGHKISNLYINNENLPGVGLFLVIGKGKLRNLSLVDVNIQGKGNVGGLAGINDGSIENTFVSGLVQGLVSVGGVVGVNVQEGMIDHSSSSVVVYSATGGAGGLCGSNYGGIKNSYATGETGSKEDLDLSEEEKSFAAGGLVGDNWGEIVNTYAVGPVYGHDSVGGLVGYNIGVIKRSCATGLVNGRNNTGGLVGANGSFWLNGGLIENCYATGNVEGDKNTGGLVGANDGLINKTYAVGRIKGHDKSTKGITGNNEGVKNSFYRIGMGEGYNAGEKRSILDLKQEETYRSYDCEDDWDFERIWAIDEGQSYPYLRNNLQANKKPWEEIQSKGKVVVQYNTPEESDPYSGPDITGAGAKEDPFVLYTFQGLEKIGTDGYPLDGYYKLGRDIDAGVTKNKDYNKGKGWKPIGNFYRMTNNLNTGQIELDWLPFTGVFDGQGYRISSLFMYRVDDGFIGFFAALGEEGIIKNLHLAEVNIKGDSSGGLVGYNRGIIQGSSVSGILESDSTLGGLVQRNDGTVVNSHTTVSIESLSTVGGLVGENYGKIKNSSSAGSVEGNTYIGGLVGVNHGVIQDSRSFADVIGDLYIGDLVGVNEDDGVIALSQAEGKVKGFERGSGSLVGLNKLFDNNYQVYRDEVHISTGHFSTRDYNQKNIDLNSLVNKHYSDVAVEGKDILEISGKTGLYYKGGSLVPFTGVYLTMDEEKTSIRKAVYFKEGVKDKI